MPRPMSPEPTTAMVSTLTWSSAGPSPDGSTPARAGWARRSSESAGVSWITLLLYRLTPAGPGCTVLVPSGRPHRSSTTKAFSMTKLTIGSDLRGLCDRMPGPVLLLDAAGVVMHANPALAFALGAPAAAFAGRNLVGLVHPDDAAAVREWLRGGAKGRREAVLRIRHA